MILRRPTPDGFALTDIEASTSPSLLVSPVPAPRSRTSSIQTFILPTLPLVTPLAPPEVLLVLQDPGQRPALLVNISRGLSA